MNPNSAINIFRALVQGIDPSTGEDLPPESVLQRADVLRALLLGQSALQEVAAREKRALLRPANNRAP